MYFQPHQSARASVAVMNVSTPQDEGSGGGCSGFALSAASLTECKPPLPTASNGGEKNGNGSGASSGTGGGGAGGPRPPPRTRPKSWTSSLFNAMSRQNHKSVNFHSVLEENNGPFGRTSGGIGLGGGGGSNSGSQSMLAGTSPQKYSSIGQQQGADEESLLQMTEEKLRIPQVQNVLSARGSRTPSPFRTMFKGIVKGRP